MIWRLILILPLLQLHLSRFKHSCFVGANSKQQLVSKLKIEWMSEWKGRGRKHLKRRRYLSVHKLAHLFTIHMINLLLLLLLKEAHCDF